MAWILVNVVSWRRLDPWHKVSMDNGNEADVGCDVVKESERFG